MIRFLTAWLLVGLEMGSLSAAELFNGTFEKGTKQNGIYQPAGWTAPATGGEAVSPGYQSNWCVRISGDGNNDGAWISDGIPLHAGEFYEFSFWGKALPGARNGSAVSGPVFCNQDYRLKEDWQKYRFQFRVPENHTEGRFRVGQWHVQGQYEFDNVQLTPVQPVYHHRGELILGRGEKLEGDRYEAQHIMAADDSNSCRFLETVEAGFNSNRWVFGPGSNVIYQHELPGNLFLSGSVSININYHQQGFLRAWVRGDHNAWTELGTLNKTTSAIWDLPANVQNTKNIEIKLEGVAAENQICEFQVDQYRFQAKLHTALAAMEGDTQFVRILKTDSRLGATVFDVGDPQPGIPTQFQMTLMNLFDRTRYLLVDLEVLGEKKSESVRRKFTFQPQEMKTVAIPYTLTDSGESTLRIRVTDQSGITFYDGEMQFDIPCLYAVDYGDLISRDKTAAVWWCPAMYKISQNRPAPNQQKSAVEFSAAQGEYEPIQVVLRPNQSLKNLNIRCEDLTGSSG